MTPRPSRSYSLIVVATLAALLIVGATVYYEIGSSTSQSQTAPSIAQTPTSSSTTPIPTSSLTLSTPGVEPTSYTNDTVVAQEASIGLPNCSAQEEAFLNEGPIYSGLGYPELTGNGDNPFNHLTPGYVYFVQFPNGTGLDVSLGDMEAPIVNVCQALGDAIADLGINSQNYTLAAVFANDGELNIAGPTLTAQWTFSFTQVDDGFWVDSSGGLYDGSGLGYAAQVVVNATGHAVGQVHALSLPSNPPNLTLNLNSTQAVEVIRHVTTMEEGPTSVASGTVDSMELRVATVRTVSGGAYPSIQPVDNSTTSGQLRLVWIITTSIPNYVGFFVVDAQSGQVLEAEGESTLPCGGAPDCGTSTEILRLPYAQPDYNQTTGMTVGTESFEVNGSDLGLKGNFSVDVPNVVVMAPGSSGSIEVNFTNDPNRCTFSGGSCIDSYFPHLGWVPSDISVNFTETSVPFVANQTVEDTLRISVSPSAAQGTYILFIEFPAPGTSYETSGYLILSVWNGQGPWPVLPMLSVPLLNGQPQPIIFSATSTSGS